MLLLLWTALDRVQAFRSGEFIPHGEGMPILQQHDRDAVQQRFNLELKRDVKITLYTQKELGGLYIPGRECKTCGTTQELLEEVSVLSSRLSLEVVDYYASLAEAQAHGIDKIPGIVISANAAHNVRFFGLPSGFEFALLLDTIAAAASKTSPLQLETRRRLKRLQDDVHIQVFVTPT